MVNSNPLGMNALSVRPLSTGFANTTNTRAATAGSSFPLIQTSPFLPIGGGFDQSGIMGMLQQFMQLFQMMMGGNFGNFGNLGNTGFSNFQLPVFSNSGNQLPTSTIDPGFQAPVFNQAPISLSDPFYGGYNNTLPYNPDPFFGDYNPNFINNTPNFQNFPPYVGTGPVINQPYVNQPVINQPTLNQPVLNQPVLNNPVLNNPILINPTIIQNGNSNPNVYYGNNPIGYNPGGYIPFGNTPYGYNSPPPIYIPGSNPRVWGDPHFEGLFHGVKETAQTGDLDGNGKIGDTLTQKYDVQGRPGETYTVLSDSGLAVNGKVGAFGDKGATVFKEAGVTVRGEDGQLYLVSEKAEGTAPPTVKLPNGQTVALENGKAFQLGGSRQTATWDQAANKVNIETFEYTGNIKKNTDGGGYLDINIKPNAGFDGRNHDGLLGVSGRPDLIGGKIQNGKEGANAQGEGVATKGPNGGANRTVDDYKVNDISAAPPGGINSFNTMRGAPVGQTPIQGGSGGGLPAGAAAAGPAAGPAAAQAKPPEAKPAEAKPAAAANPAEAPKPAEPAPQPKPAAEEAAKKK